MLSRIYSIITVMVHALNYDTNYIYSYTLRFSHDVVQIQHTSNSKALSILLIAEEAHISICNFNTVFPCNHRKQLTGHLYSTSYLRGNQSALQHWFIHPFTHWWNTHHHDRCQTSNTVTHVHTLMTHQERQLAVECVALGHFDMVSGGRSNRLVVGPSLHLLGHASPVLSHQMLFCPLWKMDPPLGLFLRCFHPFLHSTYFPIQTEGVGMEGCTCCTHCKASGTYWPNWVM